MGVVWEREVAGPCSHALVVGISDYANLPPVGKAGGPRTLGLAKLRSAALAAWRFRNWLEQACDDLVPPLASIRLMLSPSPEEIAAEPALDAAFDRPDFEDFQKEADAWRSALDEDEGTAIFYFSGHGLQQDKDSPLLLFNDFAQTAGGAFDHSARLQNIVDGMASSATTPTIAQTQYYFIDACRNAPPKMADFKSISPGVVFDDLNTKDERAVAIFQATSFGYEAEGVAGWSTYFGAALLDALAFASDRTELLDGDLTWVVTADMLRQGINDALVARQQPPRAPLGGAASRDMVFRRLKAAPSLGITIELCPEDCIAQTVVTLSDVIAMTNDNFTCPPQDHPFTKNIPMGIYQLAATPPAGSSYLPYKSQPVQVTFRTLRWPLTLKKSP